MDYIVTGVEFFQKGGAVMYVLLLCSMFVVAIGIERALHFNRMDSGRDLFSDFFKHGRLRVAFILIVKTIRIFQPERAAFFGQAIHDHGSERDFDPFQSVHG